MKVTHHMIEQTKQTAQSLGTPCGDIRRNCDCFVITAVAAYFDFTVVEPARSVVCR